MERLIYIENLHPEVDASILCSKFKKFGRILSASIDYDDCFTSLCKGHIIFENPSSVKEAIMEMNGVKIVGKPVVLKRAISKSNSGYYYKKIFIKNIDLNWDDFDLMKQFEKYGEIKNTHIYEKDGKSNGYGFVIFKEHFSAKKAIEEMNNKSIGEKILKVEPYLPKDLREDLNTNSLDYAKDMLEKSVQLNNLHVKNLPKSVDETELRELFKAFDGSITSVKVARNEAKESKGFGFVAFNSEKEAEKARFRMNGYSLNSQILEVNFNQGKEQRQHYLQLLKSDNQIAKNCKKPPRGKSVLSYPKAPQPLFSFHSKR